MMRKFIDIINGVTKTPIFEAASQEEKPSLLTLLEGKQFLAMFSGLKGMADRYHQPEIAEALTNAEAVITQLKRTDLQTWAARLIRLGFISSIRRGMAGANPVSHMENHPEDDAHGVKKNERFNAYKEELDRLYAKYQSEYTKLTGTTFGDEYSSSELISIFKRQFIQHYLGIPYSKIQNYRFTNQSMDQALTDLKAFDDEYKERIGKLLTLHEGDQIILKLANNFCWVMLDRGYCSEEANAMGHCGNAGAKYDDRILSLRQLKDTIDGVAYYEVCLTFILNGDGYLGEMKGRSNDKPAEHYHDQIIALLKLPIIKGIRGGGYAPQNNFAINDLSDEKKNPLLDTHPHLGGWTHKAERMGDDPGFKKQLIDTLRSELSRTAQWADEKEDEIAVRQWDNLDEFVDDESKDEHTKEVAKGDYNHESYREIGEDEIAGFWEKLPMQARILIQKAVVESAINEGADEEDYDMERSMAAARAIKEYRPDIADAMENAIFSGEESGAGDEAHTLLKKAIEGFKPTFGKLDIPTYEHDGKVGWTWDEPVKLVVSKLEAAKMLDAYAASEEDPMDDLWGDEELKIDQPYYGYSDFDEDAALDRFYDEQDVADYSKIEKAPEKPDFEAMDDAQLKQWISEMYAKIPDDMIRKINLEELSHSRMVLIAKGLFTQYYG